MSFSRTESRGQKNKIRKRHKTYFDYAATAPLDSGILKKMMPYLKEKYGNASSIHKFGREASEAIDVARQEVEEFLNCKET